MELAKIVLNVVGFCVFAFGGAIGGAFGLMSAADSLGITRNAGIGMIGYGLGGLAGFFLWGILQMPKRQVWMRYRLRTLMIVFALGLLAIAVFAWQASRPRVAERRIVPTPGSVRFDVNGDAYDGEGRLVFKAGNENPPPTAK